MIKPNKKIFVLDTNVILHDSSCIYQFQENDIVIPITVLEELDHFKKGNATINHHAREFVRTLDALSGDSLFNGGVEIGSSLGKISIELEKEFHSDLSFNYSKQNPDHHILNIAYDLSRRFPAKQIILVSKDVNLRMKAKSVGIMAQDYISDHVDDMSKLFSGYRTEDNIEGNKIELMYTEPFTVDIDELSLSAPPQPNEYMILRCGKKSALGVYDGSNNHIRRVDKVTAYGITPRNAEQTFAIDAIMDPSIQLVTLTGKAGTGKTLIALAGALESRKQFRQIMLARPIVALGNRDIGYLPGDIESKLDPYMQPLFDNLGVIQNQFPASNTKHKKIREFLEQEKLVICPLSYIRGRSLVNICFIIDEAQNLTPLEVKTIITRAGEGTKIIFTGDIYQIDHPYLNAHSNGLSNLIAKMQGQHIFTHINLKKGERSELAELASDLL